MAFKFQKKGSLAERPKLSLWRRIAAGLVAGTAIAGGGYKVVEHYRKPVAEKRIEIANETHPLSGFLDFMKVKDRNKSLKILEQFAEQKKQEYLEKVKANNGKPYYSIPDFNERMERAEPILKTVSSKQKVPFALLKAIAQKESSYDPEAVGGVGELGIAQLKANTIFDLNTRWLPLVVEALGHPFNNPFDAYQSLTCASIVWKIRRGELHEWQDDNKVKHARLFHNDGKIVTFDELTPREQFLLNAFAYNQGVGGIPQINLPTKDGKGMMRRDITGILNLNQNYSRELFGLFLRFGGKFN